MSIEGGNSKWSDFHKNRFNRLCIVCVRLCTHFFRLCDNPSPSKGAGTSIEGGNSKWSDFHKNGANRLCIVCVRLCTHFFRLCDNPFSAGGVGTGTSIEGGN